MFFHATESTVASIYSLWKWRTCDDTTIGKIKESSNPETWKELRSFLGVASFYRWFMSRFAHISKPLSEKNFGKGKVCMDRREGRCSLTTRIIHSIHGRFKNSNRVCDGSAWGQRKRARIHFASKILPDAETKCSAFEREAFGVNFSLNKFRNYLLSKRFKVYTEYQSLKYVSNMKDPHRKISPGFTLLAEYHFEIYYKQGR